MVVMLLNQGSDASKPFFKRFSIDVFTRNWLPMWKVTISNDEQQHFTCSCWKFQLMFAVDGCFALGQNKPPPDGQSLLVVGVGNVCLCQRLIKQPMVG